MKKVLDVKCLMFIKSTNIMNITRKKNFINRLNCVKEFIT